MLDLTTLPADELTPIERLRLTGKGPALWKKWTPGQRKALVYQTRLWLRPKQFISPDSVARIFVMLAGRGWGKTFSGSGWIKQQIFVEGCRTVGIVGQAHKDVLNVMLKGPAGLFKQLPDDLMPKKDGETGNYVFPDGQQIIYMYGDHYERIRGYEFDAVWIDEFAKFRKPSEFWETILPAIRGQREDGKSPKTLFTTTPKPNKTLRRFKQRWNDGDQSVQIIPGATTENLRNLPDGFLEEFIEEYPIGTRKYRQELLGELLDETDGSLWSPDMFKPYWAPCLFNGDEVALAPDNRPLIDWDTVCEEMKRIVICVDPAGTNAQAAKDDEGDSTGIYVIGQREDKKAVVMKRLTMRDTPEKWAKAVANAYDRFQADVVVGEVNYGGDMVRSNIHAVNPNIKFVPVTASRGKSKRAAPVSTLYSGGKVLHLRCNAGIDQGGFGFNEMSVLEDQMCCMRDDDYYGEGSPDDLDAVVWGLTYLFNLTKNKRVSGGMYVNRENR